MRVVLLAAATLAIVAVGAVAPTTAAHAPDAVGTAIAAPPEEDAVEPGTSVSDSGADRNPGLLLAVLVLPAVLVALVWMAYIFRLIFTEPDEGGNRSGQSPDPGASPPAAARSRR